jgi:hypothetical protein
LEHIFKSQKGYGVKKLVLVERGRREAVSLLYGETGLNGFS